MFIMDSTYMQIACKRNILALKHILALYIRYQSILIDRSIDWLIDRSIDRLIDWLLDWLIDWLIDWLALQKSKSWNSSSVLGNEAALYILLESMPASSDLAQNLCRIRLGITNVCEFAQLPQACTDSSCCGAKSSHR